MIDTQRTNVRQKNEPVCSGVGLQVDTDIWMCVCVQERVCVCVCGFLPDFLALLHQQLDELSDGVLSLGSTQTIPCRNTTLSMTDQCITLILTPMS